MGLNALRSVLVVVGAAGLAGQTAPLGADAPKTLSSGLERRSTAERYGRFSSIRF
jgi:hypothetical protein